MKASSAVLLGFVSNVCDYLENLIETGKSESIDLSDINLEKIKHELSERFDSHFDIPDDKVEEFKNAGTALFNKYLDNAKKNNLIDEFASIFAGNSLKEKTFSLLNSFRKEYIEINTEAQNINTEEDEDLRTIYGNAIANQNPISEIDSLYEKVAKEIKGDPEIDSIFSEIVDHEDSPLIEDDVVEIKENENDLFEDRLNDIYTIDDQNKLKPIPDEEVIIINNEDDVVEIKENENDLFEDRLNDIYTIDDQNKLKPIPDDEFIIINNEDDIKEIKTSDDVLFEERVSEAGIIGDESEDSTPLPIDDEPIEMPKDEIINEGNVELIHDEYIKGLIKQLEIQNTIEEEEKKNLEIAEEEESKVLKSIQEMYPYLSVAYIKTIYSLKEELDNEYPEEKEIIVLHRCSFNNINRLHQFVEIMLEHHYHVNVDEEKMIVDIFKVHQNSRGKIISLIFEISNQVELLNGEYEGYRVIADLENWR